MVNHADRSVVIPFRRAPSDRLELAISSFETGTYSRTQFDEFIALLDAGQWESSYFLGLYYEDGLAGVGQDFANAFHYYSLAANRMGYVEGILAAARMLYHGRGVERNFQRAFEYYERVASQTTNAVACFMLGRMFQRGEGVKKDLVSARQWMMKAVALGNVYAMLNVAMLDAEEGHWVRSISWRIKAGVTAARLGMKNRGDARLRGG